MQDALRDGFAHLAAGRLDAASACAGMSRFESEATYAEHTFGPSRPRAFGVRFGGEF